MISDIPKVMTVILNTITSIDNFGNCFIMFYEFTTATNIMKKNGPDIYVYTNQLDKRLDCSVNPSLSVPLSDREL